jgi:predicted Zn-dependent protease
VHTGPDPGGPERVRVRLGAGHEIAHVTQRHIAQIVGRQSQSAMLMLASLLVAVLAAKQQPE